MEESQVSSASEVLNGPLADLFPEKTVRLQDGRMLTVRKWTAKQVVREVPSILGDVLIKLSSLVKAGLSDTNVIVSALILDAADRVMDLVVLSVIDSTPAASQGAARITKESLDGIGADELVMLVRTVVEVNWSFFEEITRLYELTRSRLVQSGTK